jgi:hypothetical protein
MCIDRILWQNCLKICLYCCKNNQGRIYLQNEEILVFLKQTTFKSVYWMLMTFHFPLYPKNIHGIYLGVALLLTLKFLENKVKGKSKCFPYFY